MTKVDENIKIAKYLLGSMVERCKTLEEENKKLKEINESQNEEIQRFKDNAMQDMSEITELEIENRKLKEELEWYKEHYREKVDEEVLKGFGYNKKEIV